ncbi:MAG: hypothetical protein HDS55_03635 [Barnesiella sp.]|nr:hypothetical protein [Barnesiella sp.]
MRKLIYLTACFTILILAVSCKSKKIPLCAICNKIEVYFSPRGDFGIDYLVLDYIDSIYYTKGTSYDTTDFGDFSIHNDTITTQSRYTFKYRKNGIASLEEDTYSEWHIYNYRIEEGGDSLYLITFIPNDYGKAFLNIQRFYKCNSSLMYLPIGEELYKNANFLRDSLQKEYETKKKAGLIKEYF